MMKNILWNRLSGIWFTQGRHVIWASEYYIFEAMLFERLEFNCWFKIYERNWKLAVVKILYNYFPLREFSSIFFELVFKNFVRKQIFHSCYNIDLVILIDFYIPKTWKHLKKVDLNIGETKNCFLYMVLCTAENIGFYIFNKMEIPLL